MPLLLLSPYLIFVQYVGTYIHRRIYIASGPSRYRYCFWNILIRINVTLLGDRPAIKGSISDGRGRSSTQGGFFLSNALAVQLRFSHILRNYFIEHFRPERQVR